MSAIGRVGRASVVAVGLAAAACMTSPDHPTAAAPANAVSTQTPGWSASDLEFFLHGSMSVEVVPERVLRAFVRTYPDLFPTADLTGFGLLADPRATPAAATPTASISPPPTSATSWSS